MSEQRMWQIIREGMRSLWDAHRHEDKLSLGVPDVSYGLRGINGWIELKWHPAVNDEDKPIRFPHFSMDQKMWLLMRGKKGGNCYVMIQVGKRFFLFDYESLGEIGFLSFTGLLDRSILSWEQGENGWTDKLSDVLACPP